MRFASNLFSKKKKNISPQKQESEKDFFEDELENYEEEDNPASENEGEKLLYNKEDGDGMEYDVVEREILPAKIICPDCGGITLEGLEFCDKCGGELL